MPGYRSRGAVISIPTNSPGVFVPVLTPTVINGVSVQIGPTNAVIGGTTFKIGQNAPQETITANGQTISIGSGGLGFTGITVAPAPSSTNIVVLDGEPVFVYGTTKAVLGDETYTYSPGSPPETEVFNGETITLGPGGVMFGTSTINGNANPTGIQLGIVGGISVTELGPSIAVISMTTLFIGPGAAESTIVISGTTITAGSSGLVIGGATLTYPFNAAPPPTSVVTAGGITFSRIGSTLVNIGSTTFTIGPGATPTTDIVNGQTISLGPSGIAFKTTTIVLTSWLPVTAASASGTAAPTSKKSAAGDLRPVWGVWGCICICIALGVGIIF